VNSTGQAEKFLLYFIATLWGTCTLLRSGTSAIAIEAAALDVDPRVSIGGAGLNELHPRSRQRSNVVFESSAGLPAVHHPREAPREAPAGLPRLARVVCHLRRRVSLLLLLLRAPRDA